MSRLPPIPTIALDEEPLAAKPAQMDATQFVTQLLASYQLDDDWARPFLQTLHDEYGPQELYTSFYPDQSAPPVIPRYLRQGEPPATWLINFLRYPQQTDLALQETWLKQGFLADDPLWLTKLLEREKAQVARVFLLSGNISDYAYDPVVGYRTGTRLLIETLKRQKEGVLTFSLSGGLTLHSRKQEQMTKRLQTQAKVQLGRFDLSQSLMVQLCGRLNQLRDWLETDANLANGIAVIFENIHLLIPQDGVSLERNFLIDTLLSWSVSPTLFRSNHCLILMAESLQDVSHDLKSRGGKIDQITIERPSASQTRLKFLLALRQSISAMEETRAHRLIYGWSLTGYPGGISQQLELLADDTAGLTLMGIEDIVQQAAGSALDSQKVMEDKKNRLLEESGGLLEIVPPDKRLQDFAGYEKLKTRLKEIIAALQNRTDLLVRNTIPMGVLFLGPPGTGKTIAAEAIAGVSKINMVKLGDFRGMYVGQSERNLTRILSLIEALNPVIVFIDEIDQRLGKRGESGDSGVSKRIFGKLLEFMSNANHRGNILWIGASNRPDEIDDAMKRPGRFDLVLPFLLPDTESRTQIFKVILTTKLKGTSIENSLTEQDYIELAGKTENYSGAEIEGVIGEVMRRLVQRRLKKEPIKLRPLFDEVLNVYEPPLVRDEYERMENLALQEVRFMDMLSEKHQKRRQELRRQGGIRK